jgi:hypothetical protein
MDPTDTPEDAVACPATRDIDDELRLAESSGAEAALAGDAEAQWLTDPSDTIRYEVELRNLRGAEESLHQDSASKAQRPAGSPPG